MTKIDFFRQNAVSAKRENRLGVIHIAQPMAQWIIALGALLIFSSVGAFIVLGEYARKTAVTGRLVPAEGLSTIPAPVDGTLVQLLVKVGDTVRYGDALALIRSDRNLPDGRDANEVLLQGVRNKRDGLVAELRFQDELMREQRDGLHDQEKTTRIELAELNEELAFRRQQAVLGRDTLSRFQSLIHEQYVSQIQVTQQKQALLEQQANVEATIRSIATLQHNMDQIRQSLIELPTRNSLLHSQAQSQLAGLDQETVTTAANSTSLLKARFNGIISNKLVETGQSVQAGQPVLTIVPSHSKLQAQLLVPSSAIGLIQPGNEVILRYRAFPYQKFGHQKGRVMEVAKSALTPRELVSLLGEAPAKESFYRVIVKLEEQAISAVGGQHTLRPGMDVDAQILGEPRKIWEILFSLDPDRPKT